MDPHIDLPLSSTQLLPLFLATALTNKLTIIIVQYSVWLVLVINFEVGTGKFDLPWARSLHGLVYT